MKTICTYHFLMRMCFVAALAALCSADIFLLGRDAAPSALCCDILSLSSVFLLFPLSYEEIRPSVVAVRLLCFLLVGVRVALTFLLPENPCFWACTVASGMFFLVYYMVRMPFKSRNLRRLFENIATWNRVEDCARAFYALVLFFMMNVAVVLSGMDWYPPWMRIAAPAFSVLVAAFMYLRSCLAKTFFVSNRTEKRIMDVVSGNMRSCPVPGDQEDGMSKLYNKIVAYMEEQRPFLNPAFGLDELSRGVLTNKSYVSRTVNIMSGRNLCAFVNFYRIKHACALIESNPDLKVMEVAMMSGYNTVVSFNSAFRTFMSVTPRDYINKVRDRSRPPLSSFRESVR